MNTLTRREMISSTVLTAGALVTGCGDCSGCRRCEGRCPFKVKISERMQAAAQLFGC